MKAVDIQSGDIVQITDEGHHWFPALIVVDELKSFGCQGFAIIPNNRRDESSARAYIRLQSEQYERVGHCVFVPEDQLAQAQEQG